MANHRNTIESIIARLERDEVTGCWLWTGGKSDKGYGVVRFNDKNVRVHRLIKAHFDGPVADHLHSDHTCPHKHCAEPSHILLRTASDHGRQHGRPRVNFVPHRGYSTLIPEIVRVNIRHSLGLMTVMELTRLYFVHRASIAYVLKQK